jgi:hypothetical protein
MPDRTGSTLQNSNACGESTTKQLSVIVRPAFRRQRPPKTPRLLGYGRHVSSYLRFEAVNT